LFQQNQSLYASADELQDLVKEVLSWDIRSLSQRIRPHQVTLESEENTYGSKEVDDDHEGGGACSSVVYHLHLEGIDVSYRIDKDSSIIVEDAALIPGVQTQNRHGYLTWRDKLVASILWYGERPFRSAFVILCRSTMFLVNVMACNL
jgi:tRNA (adenine37-N6)-methyltransferase